jgi:hypothetical protein
VSNKFPTIIDNPDGSVAAVNLKRLAEMPYFLCSNSPNNIMQIPASQSVGPLIMSISGEGPAEIHSLACNRLAACKILLQIQDGQTQRALMNRACHVDTIFGNYDTTTGGKKQFRPYPLAEALYIDEQRAVVIIASDLSGAANTFRPCLQAHRMLTRIADVDLSRARARMDQRQYLTLPYFYTFDDGSILVPAGTTVQAEITIGQDSHFELFQISAVATSPLFDINIQDIGTGEAIVDGPQGNTFPISGNLMTGTAGFPFRFHEPRFINLHSKLLVTITDRSGADNTLFLTLSGRALADRMWS